MIEAVPQPLPEEQTPAEGKIITPVEMAEAALTREEVDGELTFPQRAGVLRYLHDAARGRDRRVDHEIYDIALKEVANMTGDPLLMQASLIHQQKYGPRDNKV